ncbi:GNAT family N-acetyltransferase [candidate division KSB1 bacterium]|nr:GNAT family N-acetyltransferase [candidate division KSB1 bacterium]
MTISKPHQDLHIRKMTAQDVTVAMNLKNIVGWNQVESDWNRFLKLEPDGCFIAELKATIVGTAIGLKYCDDLGWIGMIITHPDFQKQGIGSALMYAVMGYLSSGRVKAQKLDATPVGFSLYKRFGFISEYDIERRVGTALKMSYPDTIRAFTCDDLKRIIEFDSHTFGVNREKVLAALITENPDFTASCVNEHGTLCGYITARAGQSHVQIGPWSADTSESAEALLRFILSRLHDRSVILDVPSINRTAIDFCNKYNLNYKRGFIRMYKGENKHAGIPKKIYAISGPEKG